MNDRKKLSKLTLTEYVRNSLLRNTTGIYATHFTKHVRATKTPPPSHDKKSHKIHCYNFFYVYFYIFMIFVGFSLLSNRFTLLFQTSLLFHHVSL